MVRELITGSDVEIKINNMTVNSEQPESFTPTVTNTLAESKQLNKRTKRFVGTAHKVEVSLKKIVVSYEYLAMALGYDLLDITNENTDIEIQKKLNEKFIINQLDSDASYEVYKVNAGVDRYIAQKFISGNDLESFVLRLEEDGTTKDVKIAIYEHDVANNQPGVLVAGSEQTITAADVPNEGSEAFWRVTPGSVIALVNDNIDWDNKVFTLVYDGSGTSTIKVTHTNGYATELEVIDTDNGTTPLDLSQAANDTIAEVAAILDALDYSIEFVDPFTDSNSKYFSEIPTHVTVPASSGSTAKKSIYRKYNSIYWLVIYTTDDSDEDNATKVFYNSTRRYYDDGKLMTSDDGGSTWTNLDFELAFEVVNLYDNQFEIKEIITAPSGDVLTLLYKRCRLESRSVAYEQEGIVMNDVKFIPEEVEGLIS